MNRIEIMLRRPIASMAVLAGVLVVAVTFSVHSSAQEAAPAVDASAAEGSAGAAPETAASTDATAQPSAAGTSGSGKAAPAGATAAQPEELKLPPPPPRPPEKIDYELQTYRVSLPIVFEPHPSLSPARRAGIIRELQALADRSIGPMWNLTIEDADWITPRTSAGLRRLSAEGIRQRIVEEELLNVIHEQLIEYTSPQDEAQATHSGQKPDPELKHEGPVFQPTITKLSDALRMRLRNALAEPDGDTQHALLREITREVAGTAVKDRIAETVAEVVFLYITPPPIDVDKVFPVAVEVDGPQFVISAREWDRESELISDLRSARTLDHRTIASGIMRLVSRLFRPTMEINEADPTTARITFKGGEYPAGDPAFRQTRVGSIFVPFFRYLDRRQVVQKLQFLPWTYLTATSLERFRARCDVGTGVQTPLGAFRRRRMELRAIALQPDLPSTTLTLMPRGRQSGPLVGYLVAVYDQPPPPPPPPPKEGEEAPAASAESQPEPPKPDIYRSDRFGNVSIPVDPDHAMQWVYIRSGSALLTRFPFVPGAEQQMVASCPDDTLRLDVEGQIALLQSRLADTIAKQTMVKSMIQARAKKSEWDKIDDSMEVLTSLPTLEDFTQEINDIQYPAIKKAQARRDKATEGKIKKLGSEVLKVAAHYLDKKKMEDFVTEIEETRRIETGQDNGPRRAPGQR